jgi:hypothetical protein
MISDEEKNEEKDILPVPNFLASAYPHLFPLSKTVDEMLEEPLSRCLKSTFDARIPGFPENVAWDVSAGIPLRKMKYPSKQRAFPAIPQRGLAGRIKVFIRREEYSERKRFFSAKSNPEFCFLKRV